MLSVSLHRHGEGFFPGSGGLADTGEGTGKNHTVNIPVTDGFNDEDAESVLMPIIKEAAARFQPHAIVCCAGAGVISGDRLGCLNMTLSAHAACLQALAAISCPLLVLGAGGFTQLNTARAFCNATAALCQATAPKPIRAQRHRARGERG